MPWVQRNQNGTICAIYALKHDECAEEFLDDTNDEVVEFLTTPKIISVSPMQVRIALLNAGMLDTVQSAIDAKGGAIKIKWEYATEIRSDDADLISLATELGIADQIPPLFKAAQAI